MTREAGPAADWTRGEFWKNTAVAGAALLAILILPLLELVAANQGHGLSRRALASHFGWIVCYTVLVAVGLQLLLFRVALWRILIALVPVAFLFFAYHSINSTLHVDSLMSSASQANLGSIRILVLTMWACLFAGAFWLGLRLWRTPTALRRVLAVAALLLLVPAWRLVASRSVEAVEASERTPGAAPDISPARHLPNIYWLVADGYPRGDTLRDEFAFDNSAFHESLERMGFVLSRQAVANYPLTYFSVASMADMSYVIDEKTPPEIVRDVKRFTRKVGGDNELVRQLRRRGYRYVHFATGYEQSTLCSGIEDLCILGTNEAIDEIGLVLLRRTPMLDLALALLPVSAKLATSMPFSWRGFDALEDHLAEIHRVRKPFLLYAHVLDPHPPFRHNADCSMRPASPDLMDWSPAQRPAFVAEIQCVNRQLGRVLDEIVNHDPSAIVIVNADHGSAFRQQFSKPLDDWGNEEVRERFSPLLAVRLPAHCRDAAARLQSLVNVFRVVLNCMSDADLPALPDQQFITLYNDSTEFGIVRRVPSRPASCAGYNPAPEPTVNCSLNGAGTRGEGP